MPSRSIVFTIVVLWLISMAILVERDLLPRLQWSDVNYRSYLANRVVEETALWTIYCRGADAGSLFVEVRPVAETGGFLQFNHVRLNTNQFLATPTDDPTWIRLESQFNVRSTGHLQDFMMTLAVEGGTLKAHLRGEIQGSELVLHNQGIPLLSPETRVAVDPQTMVLDAFGAVDRLPNLSVGKRWTTRVINPFTSVLGVGSLFGASAVEVVQHQVVEQTEIDWRDQQHRCFVVESRHNDKVGKTFVRVSDGRVLKQRLPLGGDFVELVLDKSSERM